MKEITIYQKNDEKIIFTDDDDTDLIKYTQDLSQVLKADTVRILETTSGNFIVRPSRINTIKITNQDNLIQTKDPNPSEIESEVESMDEDVDYIIDGD